MCIAEVRALESVGTGGQRRAGKHSSIFVKFHQSRGSAGVGLANSYSFTSYLRTSAERLSSEPLYDLSIFSL